jgi:hypothetical protein
MQCTGTEHCIISLHGTRAIIERRPKPRGFETEKRQKIKHLLEQMLKGNALPNQFYTLMHE